MHLRAPRPILAAVPLAALLALTGCSGSDSPDPKTAAPTPAASLPPAVDRLSKTVGQYFVTPRPGLPPEQLQSAVAKVAKMPGVQSAQLQGDKVNVEFFGNSTPAQHTAVLKQLVSVGTVEEGV